MDPNHWRNYNQAYGHLGHSGLSPAANINLPLLAAEQAGISPTGLGLGSLQAHPSVRGVGGLSAVPVTYSHPLHNPVSQFLDSVNPLQAAYSSQTPFKPSSVAQSPFSLDPSVRTSDQSSIYGLSPEADNIRSHPKSIFVEEGISSKELAKNWGLASFAQSQPNLYGLPPDVTSPTHLTSPPPAHSGSAGSRVQRNASSDNLYSGNSSAGKSAFTSRSTDYMGEKQSYQLSNPPHQMNKNRSDYSVSGHSVKDLTKSQSLSQSLYNSYVSSASIITSDSLYHQSSQIQSKMASDMNYDPVSPATPDAGQQNDDYRSVLQDFDAGIHGQESHHIDKYGGMSRSGSQQNVAQEVKQQQVHSSNIGNAQSLHSTHSQSPMQQSPLNMGGSPHMQMGIGSPQMPSSTMVQSAPPVQAIPDSTTKPKRARGRKKKENPSEKPKQENLSQNMNQSPTMSQISSPMGNMMNMNNQQYNQHMGHSYSPQKPQPCSPHTSQAYSPQINVQSMSSNSMSINSPINHMSGNGMGDSVIRSANTGHMLKNSPPVQMVSASSMSLSDNLSMSSSGPLLAESILGSDNYGYENVPTAPSFVEQLHADVRLGHMDKSGLDDPLGMHSLGLADTGNIYTDLDHYNNQYDNASNSVPPYGDSQLHPGHPTSTIDEMALSSLMGHAAHKDSPGMLDESPEKWRMKDEQKQMIPHEVDDEFQHLAKPPAVKKEPKTSNPKVLGAPLETPPPKPPVPTNTGDNRQSSANNSFLGSFLSFIQGKKPETLSSVNNSVVKRPELPKYVPEPRRPRPPDPPEIKNTNEKTKDSAKMSFSGSSAESAMGFSDDDDDDDTSNSNLNNTLKTVILNLSDSDDKPNNQSGNPPLKLRISVSKASFQPKKSSKSRSKSSRSRNKSESGKRSRSHSLMDDDDVAVVSEDESKQPVEEFPDMDFPPSPAPLRRSSRKTTETKKKYVDSDEELEGIISDEESPVKVKLPDEEIDYDSDVDPVWTPFATDNKRQPAYDSINFDERPSRRSKPKMPKYKSFTKSKGKSNRRASSEMYSSEDSNDAPFKIQRMNEPTKKTHMNVFRNNQFAAGGFGMEEERQPEPAALPGFKVGDFILDKKDLNKFESFPVWRIEPGKMIRKYELFTENGQIRHRAICTFSSWMQSMQRDFIPITIKVVTGQKDKEVVEVDEKDRPKPKLDSTLETAYEEDPLAEMFNVYMQIFLSQAMEPGFLGAIQEAGEDFYLGPLNKIDQIIETKQDEIEAKVKWRDQFRGALKCKPHIRELDRPNLKQACQACEHASQPAIKSVHLFGQSYDHFTLEDHPVSSTEGGSMEFLIGRTAANYVGAYHSLYHYKYNLYKRCVAKIDIVKQENPTMDNADILDKCLNNRTWVLKIFDDLKTMLDKG